jgi:hypothetical protein
MATKPASLAVITLDGFQHYLLPADRALKIVALMEGAVSVEQDYTSRNFARKEWVTKNETTVSYETAKADSIRTPEGEAAQMPKRSGARASIEGKATRLLTEGGDQ